MSVRARPDGDGIAYRVIDEYPEDSSWRLPIERSEQPLTLEEMQRLLRDTYMIEEPEVRGIAHGFRERSNPDGDPEMARGLVDFVRVTSRFYPELEALDHAEGEAWAARLEGET